MAFEISPIPQAFYCLEQGKWLELNESFVKMFGYSKKTLMKKTFEDITHPEDLHKSDPHLKKLIKGEIENFKLLKRYIHANGDILHGMLSVSLVRNDQGAPDFVISQLQDVTELVSATKTLEEKEKQLCLVVNNIYDGFWDWDLRTNYEYMSPRFWEILGYKPEGKKHHPSEWQKLILEEDLKRVLKNFDLHVSSKGKEPFRQEVRYIHNKGHIVWILCKGEVVEWGKKGEPLRMVGTHTDITELKKSQELLISGSKMIALGEMAGGIAHEINTPLTVISSHVHFLLQRLKNGSSDKEKCQDSLIKIDQTVFRMSKIVESLLNFSREEPDEDQKKPHSLSDLMMQTLSFCKEKFSNHNVRIELVYEENPSDEILIGTEFSQVLLNLLNNAFYAVKNLDGERLIKLEVQKMKKIFKVLVTDNGPGVPKGLEQKIMMPFFTTKPASEGTGLGLSISSRIMQKSGGSLCFKSKPGKTTFVIEVPAVLKFLLF